MPSAQAYLGNADNRIVVLTTISIWVVRSLECVPGSTR